MESALEFEFQYSKVCSLN